MFEVAQNTNVLDFYWKHIKNDENFLECVQNNLLQLLNFQELSQCIQVNGKHLQTAFKALRFNTGIEHPTFNFKETTQRELTII